jgi:hypothetical protein
LELNRFFNGHLEAYGLVQDYSGRVTRRFKADILGVWENNHGVLDEIFYYDDGEQQHRCWRLTKQGNLYTGTADDVIGQAQGATQGNALNWQYTLTIMLDGEPWHFQLDDWLFLIDEQNMINRTKLKKFGLHVADLTLSIHQRSAQPHRPVTAGCDIRTDIDPSA